MKIKRKTTQKDRNLHNDSQSNSQTLIYWIIKRHKNTLSNIQKHKQKQKATKTNKKPYKQKYKIKTLLNTKLKVQNDKQKETN